jgi:hypothetical protein
MDKSNVRKIERDVQLLIKVDDSVWVKNHWENGDQVSDNWRVYLGDLKTILNKKGVGKLSGVVYHVLENINFHTLNKALDEMGYFGKEGYYADSSDAYQEYRKLGGQSFI